MSIPLNFKIKKINREIKIKYEFQNKNLRLMVWWYSGILKNVRDSFQPRVRVAFRELRDDNVSLSKKLFFEKIPITLLGQVGIGTIWQNGVCISETTFETKTFEVDFSLKGWQKNSFDYASLNKKNPPFRQNIIYPLNDEFDKNWLIDFHISSGGKLTIPCLEFFYKCYGRSAEIKRILTTVTHNSVENRLYAQWGNKENTDLRKIKLQARIRYSDTVFVTYVKYDNYAKRCAKSINIQIESQYEPKKNKPIFIEVAPWHQKKIKIVVKGISHNNNKSFLGLQIMDSSDPPGNPIIKYKNKTIIKITNKPEEPPKWGKKKGIIKSGEEVEITGDMGPDHGAPTLNIPDPTCDTIGGKREIIDFVEEKTKDKVKRSFTTENPSKFSSGESYGSDKGVAYASISSSYELESHGTLRDMWKATQYLLKKKPDIFNSVEWFTFDDGFCSVGEPRLIKLKAFKNNIEISRSIKNWVYLDSKKKDRLRGILVIRIKTPIQTIFIVEVQRRKPVKGKKNTKDKKECFQGISFVIYDTNFFEPWIFSLLFSIGMFKGIVKNVVNSCPGFATTFKHVKVEGDKVLYETAVMNAITKLRYRVQV